MHRAPIVLAGTAAGLFGVLSYQTSPPPSAITVSSSAKPAAAPSASSAVATSTPSAAVTTSASTSSARIRTAIGDDVSFKYGDLEVKVTMTGKRVTDITVVKHDVADPRSDSIDAAALPQLQQEALSAQSAKIDGVSGASYTSAAYEQSLQSALDKLA